jgi:hypothetical protein
VTAQSLGVAAQSRDVWTGWNCLWPKLIHVMDRSPLLAGKPPDLSVQSPGVATLLPTSVVSRADTSVLYSDIRVLTLGRAVQWRCLVMEWRCLRTRCPIG